MRFPYFRIADTSQSLISVGGGCMASSENHRLIADLKLASVSRILRSIATNRRSSFVVRKPREFFLVSGQRRRREMFDTSYDGIYPNPYLRRPCWLNMPCILTAVGAQLPISWLKAEAPLNIPHCSDIRGIPFANAFIEGRGVK